MLGRKNYTQEEIATGKEAIEQQLAAYDAMEDALTKNGRGAREAFAERFFNNMLLVLDRYYVHRLAGPITKARRKIPSTRCGSSATR